MSVMETVESNHIDQPESHVEKFHRISVDKREIIFPKSRSFPKQGTGLQCQTSIVVVGPNGAGKSRLGAWLEMEGPQKSRVHRITAQRSITFPDSVSPIGMQKAYNQFHWAPVPSNWDESTYDANKDSLRIQQRYGGTISNAVTAPLNDINNLMTLLFSENYSALLEREETELESGKSVRARETLIRKAQRIWQSLLPHRKLKITSGDVQVEVNKSDPTKKSYPAKAMSDGERVIFYLIGQCLCAKENSIILVDEPEIHLHKAIQDALWSRLEEARQDCTFIYLTHDLSFAADRTGATRVCLTGYDEGEFDWFKIEPQDDIPDEVYFEVLGSRKDVLFVEGTLGSLDVEFYQLVFPQFTIKPMGGCAAVMAATKAFRKLKKMHNLNCYGVIDRDYLVPAQIEAYAKSGIYTLKVAEIENLYLVPELFECMADQLLVDKSAVDNAIDYVIMMFSKDIHKHAMSVMNHQIILSLGRFNSANEHVEGYTSELESHLRDINPAELYNLARREAESLIAHRDYRGILAVYNKKDISSKISHIFEIRNGTYTEKVREMSRRGKACIVSSLLPYFPEFKE